MMKHLLDRLYARWFAPDCIGISGESAPDTIPAVQAVVERKYRIGTEKVLLEITRQSNEAVRIFHPRTAVLLQGSEPQVARHLLSNLTQAGLAVVNVDDPPLLQLVQDYPVPRLTFGFSPQADIHLTNMQQNRRMMKLSIRNRTESALLTLPRPVAGGAIEAMAAALCINADEGNTLTEGCRLLERAFTP